MMKKSKSLVRGVKGNTPKSHRTHKPHKHHHTIDSEERVNVCLSCKKPASECKGNCFGKY
jgi:hypothetical protein